MTASIRTRQPYRPRGRRVRRQAVRATRALRWEPRCESEWPYERPVVLRELWTDPEPWPLWQEASAAAAVLVGVLVVGGGA